MFGRTTVERRDSMSDSRSFKVVARYGLIDQCGRVVMLPAFEDVLINDAFILGKFGGRWGIIHDFGCLYNNKFEFEDVMAFDNVLWFKKFGMWGARNSDERILVRPKYERLSRMDNSNVIEAVCERESRYEYFSLNGCRLYDDAALFRVYDFEMGYAMGLGYRKGDTEQSYFIISANSGKPVKYFEKEGECKALLEELRNDYIWSKSLGES